MDNLRRNGGTFSAANNQSNISGSGEMKRIADYQIIDHGAERSDYFQGCGTSFTEYTDGATGIGDSETEAINDALEQLALDEWDVSTITETGDSEITVPDDANDTYHYVSIRVRGE
jgi:hypothetical protein